MAERYIPGVSERARPLDHLRRFLDPAPTRQYNIESPYATSRPGPPWKYGDIAPLKSRDIVTQRDPIYGAPQAHKRQMEWGIPAIAKEVAQAYIKTLEAPRTGIMPSAKDLLEVGLGLAGAGIATSLTKGGLRHDPNRLSMLIGVEGGKNLGKGVSENLKKAQIMEKKADSDIHLGGLQRTPEQDLELTRYAASKNKDLNKNIWENTGWFKNPGDNLWRMEIHTAENFKLKSPDFKAWQDIPDGTRYRYKNPALKSSLRWEDFLSFPELEKAYPGIKNIHLDISLSKHNTEVGNYRPAFGKGSPKITISRKTPEELKSAILHEVQHYIQYQEGFAKGAGLRVLAERLARGDQQVQKWIKDALPELSKLAKDNLKEAKHIEDRLPILKDPKKTLADKEEIRQLRENSEKIDKILSGSENYPFEQIDAEMFKSITQERTEQLKLLLRWVYAKHAGEVEARLVQDRMDYTPKQRFPERIKGGGSEAISPLNEAPSWGRVKIPEQIVERVGQLDRAHGGPVYASEILHMAEGGPSSPLYHVTFSKNLPDIQERGLNPLSQSLWNKEATGARYQDQPAVFSFKDPEEAMRWAFKMGYEFDVKDNSEISIIKLRGGGKWEPDPAAGGLEGFRSGVRTLRPVSPSEIQDVMSFPDPVTINEEFQRRVPGGRIDEWVKFYGSRLKSLGEESSGSRPKDPSNLPAIISKTAALAAFDEPRPKGKGQRFRGIGSLMRRRLFPLIQAAQLGYEHLLSPEQKAEIKDFLESPAHEMVGMDKPGIEYFKDLLGVSETEPQGEGVASLAKQARDMTSGPRSTDQVDLSQIGNPLKDGQPLGPIYDLVPKEQVPIETRRVYKLVKLLPSRPGLVFPLYAKPVGPSQGFTTGQWFRAKVQVPKIGGKKLAPRSGIHSMVLPVFDQGTAQAAGETRVWMEVEIPVINKGTQIESDTSEVLDNGQRKGIRDRLIDADESYDFKTNPASSIDAGGWPISGSARFVRVVPDQEIASVLLENNLDHQIENSTTGIDDSRAAELNSEMGTVASLAEKASGEPRPTNKAHGGPIYASEVLHMQDGGDAIQEYLEREMLKVNEGGDGSQDVFRPPIVFAEGGLASMAPEARAMFGKPHPMTKEPRLTDLGPGTIPGVAGLCGVARNMNRSVVA